jgi:hypothetical protein
MLAAEPAPSAGILNHAERELGAFLEAVVPVVGPEGISHARDLWIETLRDADCSIGEELTGFFRSVTIHTVSQLAKNVHTRPLPQ